MRAQAAITAPAADRDMSNRVRSPRCPRRGGATGERPDSVDGWFEDNLANHAATARAIEEGDAEEARHAMEQVLGFNRSELSRRKAGAGRRNGRPGGSRSLRKK